LAVRAADFQLTGSCRKRAATIVTAVFVAYGVPSDARTTAHALFEVAAPLIFPSGVLDKALTRLHAYFTKSKCCALADDAAKTFQNTASIENENAKKDCP